MCAFALRHVQHGLPNTGHALLWLTHESSDLDAGIVVNTLLTARNVLERVYALYNGALECNRVSK